MGEDVNTWFLFCASISAFFFSIRNKWISSVLIGLILFLNIFNPKFPQIYFSLGDTFAFLALLPPLIIILISRNDVSLFNKVLIIYSIIMIVVASIVKMFDGPINGWFLLVASLTSFGFAVYDLVEEHTSNKNQYAHLIVFLIILFIHFIWAGVLLMISKQAIVDLKDNLLNFAEMFAYLSIMVPIYIAAKRSMEKWAGGN